MILIDQQQKEEWEARIDELEKTGLVRDHHLAYYEVYKELLFQAIVVPVEESWDQWWKKSADDWFNELKKKYQNGVMIKSK